MTAIHPPEISALSVGQGLQQAIARHCAGQLQEAQSRDSAILQAQSNHPEANFNLGVLILHLKQPASGLRHLKVELAFSRYQNRYWRTYTHSLSPAKQTGLAQQALMEARQLGL